MPNEPCEGAMCLDRADYDRLIAERDELREQVCRMASTMKAAAAEIEEHWAAHCDSEGYGPRNLVERLRGEDVKLGYACYPGHCDGWRQLVAERDEYKSKLDLLAEDYKQQEEELLAARLALKAANAREPWAYDPTLGDEQFTTLLHDVPVRIPANRIQEMLRERDELRAALSAYRKALQGLVDAIREMEEDIPDSASHMIYCAEVNEAVAVLASDAGKATLKWIETLEHDVEEKARKLAEAEDDRNLLQVKYAALCNERNGALPYAIDPQQQTCKVCGRPMKLDFHVPDDVWAQVVPDEYRNYAICLYCFDEFAKQRATDYTPQLEMWFAGKMANFHLIAATWLAEAEAGAAAMREALEFFRACLWFNPYPLPEEHEDATEEDAMSRVIIEALSSNAGRDFLKRLREAEDLLSNAALHVRRFARTLEHLHEDRPAQAMRELADDIEDYLRKAKEAEKR